MVFRINFTNTSSLIFTPQTGESDCAESRNDSSIRLCFPPNPVPRAGQWRAWNPIWSSNPTDYFRSYQSAIVADNLNQQPLTPTPTPETSHDDGFDFGRAYADFFRFTWWRDASAGERVVGSFIAGVAALAAAGTFVLGGEVLLGGGLSSAGIGSTAWGVGGAALGHEGIYAVVAANQIDPDARPTHPSLVERARSGLEAWSRDRNARFDHGHFLLDAEREAPGSSTGDSRAWDELVQRIGPEVRRESDPFAQLAALRRQLYLLADTGHYRVRNAGIGDLLQGQGGNCSARGKVVMAMIEALNIRLPQPWVLGLQNYRHHLEPVAYNPQTQERLNLRTGETGRGLDSHLYSPMVLPQAFLRARGVDSPVSDDQLILARATVPARPPQPNQPIPPRTNDTLEFPPSEFDSEGSFPEEAFDPPPVAAAPAPAGSPLRTPGQVLPSYSAETWPFRDATGLEEVRDRIRNMILPFQAPTRNSLLFRDPAQSEFYNSLSSPRDRQLYLTQVFTRDMAAFIAGPEGRGLIEVLNHPETLISRPRAELEERFHSLRNLHRRMAEFTEIVEGQGADREISQILPNFWPVYDPMAQALGTMNGYIRGQSPELLRNLDAAPAEQRFITLRILGELRSFLPHFPMEPFDQALNQAVLLERRPRVGLGSTPPAAPLELPRAGAIEIEFWGPPSSETPIQTGVHATATEPPTPPADISYRTFLEAFIVTQSDQATLARRWTPEISARFLRLNRNGFYDGFVQGMGPQLIAARHPSIRVEEINFDAELPRTIDPDLREIFARARERRHLEGARPLPPDQD